MPLFGAMSRIASYKINVRGADIRAGGALGLPKRSILNDDSAIELMSRRELSGLRMLLLNDTDQREISADVRAHDSKSDTSKTVISGLRCQTMQRPEASLLSVFRSIGVEIEDLNCGVIFGVLPDKWDLWRVLNKSERSELWSDLNSDQKLELWGIAGNIGDGYSPRISLWTDFGLDLWRSVLDESRRNYWLDFLSPEMREKLHNSLSENERSALIEMLGGNFYSRPTSRPMSEDL